MQQYQKKILILVCISTILTIGNVQALENGVIIPLVADRATTGGDVGSYLNAQVIVTNGTGHVFVDTNPFTQVDLQGSARIAAMIASDILGVDEKSYDFYYIIEIDSPVIGGPSAGGALTVATIAAMNNWTIKPGIAMTGMIDPDETIGPVGGIPYKLQAAAANNITTFLVPQGQLITNITNFSLVNKSSSVEHDMTQKSIDLVQLGNDLSVTVKEIETIQDAVLEFTGHDISRPITNETVFTSSYLNLLQPLALRLQNESNSMYNDIISISNNNLMKVAKDSQNHADQLLNEKKYYAATSLYFSSMINILTVQWNYNFDQAQNKDVYITSIIDETKNQIKMSEDVLNKSKSNGIRDVEVIGAAESRIMEANNTLDKLPDNPGDLISALAFSYERARSAQWWLALASTSGNSISEDVLKDRSGWYLSQAQSISAYTQALLTGSGISMGNMGDTTLIQKEIDRGYYSGAIFDSLEIISILGTGIELAGIEDPSIRINQSAISAQSMINEVRSKGIEPTLAVSVYEHGETLINPFDKKFQYSYARMIAKVTENLYSQEKLINQTVTLNATSILNITISNKSANKSPALGFVGLIAIIMYTRYLIKIRRK